MSTPATPLDASEPLQVHGDVLANEGAGAYRVLTIQAPGVPARFRPGQFVTLAVGGHGSTMLGRRAFSVYEVVRGVETGQATDQDAVRVVIAVHGAGTAWLARLRPGDQVDVVGPLGQPFTLPSTPESAPPTTPPFPAEDRRPHRHHDTPHERSSAWWSARRCVLVGGGYGSAPLFSLADQLIEHGQRAHFVLGAATADRIFGAERARRTATTTVTTVDGSLGRPGMVTDVLAELLLSGDGDAQVEGDADGRASTDPPGRVSGDVAVYACGPMPMLRAVTAVAAEHQVPAQVAVEESMACGIGVCMTCVLPIVGDDGVTRMTRSCVEGPVFAGDAVRWGDVGAIPEDIWGAP